MTLGYLKLTFSFWILNVHLLLTAQNKGDVHCQIWMSMQEIVHCVCRCTFQEVWWYGFTLDYCEWAQWFWPWRLWSGFWGDALILLKLLALRAHASVVRLHKENKKEVSGSLSFSTFVSHIECLSWSDKLMVMQVRQQGFIGITIF